MKTMLKILVATAALAIVIPAGAAPQSATQADTENIKVSTAIELYGGLSALGFQHDELIGAGNNQKVVAVPFSFSADTLWAISDNLAALKKVITTYQTTIRTMQADAEAKNGGPLKPDVEAKYDNEGRIVKPEIPSAKQKALAEAIQKVFDGERPINKLFRIKRGDLCLGGKFNSPDCPKDAANKISPSVIMQLESILER